MTHALCRDGDLSRAQLMETVLVFTDLTGANLTSACLNLTVFGNTKLFQASGLETCIHYGHSMVDHATIASSKGVSEQFWKGCGVPEELLRSAQKLPGRPEYYSSFVSYHHDDEEFAWKLVSDLQRAGVTCFLAPFSLEIGDPIRARIEQTIREYDKLILILSMTALESRWVEYEVKLAFAKEASSKEHILLPIRIDNAVMHAAPIEWAHRIVDASRDGRLIGDFTLWKETNQYENSFRGLLRSLRR